VTSSLVTHSPLNQQTLLGNSWQVLYLTSIVAVFHILFDLLAFKNGECSFSRHLF
jgi:hypothetical protein